MAHSDGYEGRVKNVRLRQSGAAKQLPKCQVPHKANLIKKTY